MPTKKRRAAKTAKRRATAEGTPITVTIGPIPEWRHIGVTSLVPTQRTLLVPSQDTDCVSIVDLNEFNIVNTVKLAEGSAPWHVKATPDGRYAYVSNSRFNGHVNTAPQEASSVSVIDLAKGQVVKDVRTMGGPVMIEMDKRRARAYVTNRFSNTVSVIDTKKHENVATVEVGAAPFWVRMTPKEDLLVVGNFEDASLSLIDPDSLKVLSTIPVGSPGLDKPFPEFGPGDTLGFAIGANGVAHVANWRSHTIVTVDVYDAVKGGRRSVRGSQQLVEFPFGIEIAEEQRMLIVGSYNVARSRLNLFEFDTAKSAVGSRIADLPVSGASIPRGSASTINYWMSEPFESRIVGYLTRGPRIVNPIDLVAIVL